MRVVIWGRTSMKIHIHYWFQNLEKNPRRFWDVFFSLQNFYHSEISLFVSFLRIVYFFAFSNVPGFKTASKNFKVFKKSFLKFFSLRFAIVWAFLIKSIDTLPPCIPSLCSLVFCELPLFQNDCSPSNWKMYKFIK